MSAPPSQRSRAAASGVGWADGTDVAQQAVAVPGSWQHTTPSYATKLLSEPSQATAPSFAWACLRDGVAAQGRHIAAAENGIIHAAGAGQPLGRHCLAGTRGACREAGEGREHTR